MRRLAFVVAAVAIATGLAACLPGMPGGWGFVHDQKLVGPYHLVAVDVREQMALCVRVPSGCEGHGPSATVVAAGFDDRHIVVVRRQEDLFGAPEEYWYIVRDLEAEEVPRAQTPLGPYGRAEFEALKSEHDLPPFSVVFDDLRPADAAAP
jgi:hypothetical protein